MTSPFAPPTDRSFEERLAESERKLFDLRESLCRKECEDSARIGCPSLRKAIQDPFDYALRLRTGEVIRFYSATYIDDEWIHLEFESHIPVVEAGVLGLPYPACRGVDVRVSDIVWCMDAPEGS